MFCCLLPAFTSDSQACRIRFGKIEPSGRICESSTHVAVYRSSLIDCSIFPKPSSSSVVHESLGGLQRLTRFNSLDFSAL
jgi:hypothetical protein